jgi:glycosyltransferase involved in cell wall biosynthesis
MNMRVAHFATEYPPCISGGLGRHVEELIKELKTRVEIDLYLPFDEPTLNHAKGFTIYQTPIPSQPANLLSSYYIRLVFRMGFHMARICLTTGRDYDVIHCHDWLTGVTGLLLKRMLGRKLVVTCHLPQFRPSEAILEQMILKEADTVVAVSDYIKTLLIERNDLSPQKVLTIRNAVDASFFVPDSYERDATTLLFVGRIVPQKGLDVLIYSLRYLIPKIPGIKLCVVGDGDWVQDARNLARDCGYPEKVEFCGWKSKEELLRYYQKCSVFVMPSQFEPFGLTALEAMACGLPVVASRVGGLREIVVEDWNGFLVDMKNPPAFAGRIFQLLEDPLLWKKFSYNSRMLAVENSWASVADRMMFLYNTLTTDCSYGAVGNSLGHAFGELWRSYRRNYLTGETL